MHLCVRCAAQHPTPPLIAAPPAANTTISIAPTTLCADAAASAPSCAGWAAAGECTRNAVFMAANCMLSCRLCTVPAELPTAAPMSAVATAGASVVTAACLLQELRCTVCGTRAQAQPCIGLHPQRAAVMLLTVRALMAWP
jgi:hypothetical protein